MNAVDGVLRWYLPYRSHRRDYCTLCLPRGTRATGYAEDVVENPNILRTDTNFLEKPFLPDELLLRRPCVFSLNLIYPKTWPFELLNDVKTFAAAPLEPF
jgi:hypothetical protein